MAKVTPKGILGHQADMTPATIISLLVTEAVAAGDALQYDGPGKAKKYVGGKFAGFALGNSGKDTYAINDSVPTIQQGTVWLAAAAGVTANDTVGISVAGALAKAHATTYKYQVNGSLFTETITAAGLVKVRLFGTETTTL